MTLQQVLLSDGVTAGGGVPSGDPFIIDLDFPGSIDGIPSTAVYTFPQAVFFPISAGGVVFDGSTVTFDGTVGGFQYNFYMKPPDGTSLDELLLILTSVPPFSQFNRQILDQIWNNSHCSGGAGPQFYENGIITFYAGDQLFMDGYYSDGGAGTAENLHLTLVGEAV